jgi:hypothetical protein
MGFWGTILVACAEQPLTELVGVRELEEHVVWHGRGAGGWQVAQLHRPPVDWRVPMTGSDGLDRLLESLLAQTRRPVLAATVLDSDGAQLVGYSPRAGRWSGWLMLERMVEYIGEPYTDVLNDYDEEDLPADLDAFWQERYELACRPLYELSPPAGVAAPHAVAWAVEAGFAPAVDAVAAVLDGNAVFAEEHVLHLLAVLGLPPLTAA